MADLEHITSWASALLEKLDAKERRKLARTIATDLRRSQRQRIADQLNPDGSRYAPRRAQQKTGRIRRRAMFARMRTTKFLKQKYNANSVSVGFFGDIAKIARVHQYGLKDEVAPGGPEVQYDQRELVGFSARDVDLIESNLTAHLLK
jgi:phage virion morphogenesis protein